MREAFLDDDIAGCPPTVARRRWRKMARGGFREAVACRLGAHTRWPPRGGGACRRRARGSGGGVGGGAPATAAAAAALAARIRSSDGLGAGAVFSSSSAMPEATIDTRTRSPSVSSNVAPTMMLASAVDLLAHAARRLVHLVERQVVAAGDRQQQALRPSERDLVEQRIGDRPPRRQGWRGARPKPRPCPSPPSPCRS